MKDRKLYEDCGCNYSHQICSTKCIEFATCRARLIVAELKKPLPSGKPYMPTAKQAPTVTNAALAQEYGITKRQVVKARQKATSNQSLHRILQGLKNE